jgi:NADH-quinone oxidoreductase subunit J
VSNNTQEIGTQLFSTYLLPFEITSLLLLVAMIGAIVLAKRQLD